MILADSLNFSLIRYLMNEVKISVLEAKLESIRLSYEALKIQYDKNIDILNGLTPKVGQKRKRIWMEY